MSISKNDLYEIILKSRNYLLNKFNSDVEIFLFDKSNDLLLHQKAANIVEYESFLQDNISSKNGIPKEMEFDNLKSFSHYLKKDIETDMSGINFIIEKSQFPRNSIYFHSVLSGSPSELHILLRLDKNKYELSPKFPNLQYRHKSLITSLNDSRIVSLFLILLHGLNSGWAKIDYKVFSPKEVFLLISEVIKLIGIEVEPNVFIECFNALSYHPYETNDVKGNIALCSDNSEFAKKAILLKDPVSLTSIRGVRKLVEITSLKMHLFCNGEKIYGFGEISNLKTENIFSINFEKKGQWELRYNDEPILSMNGYKKPTLHSKVKQEVWMQWLKSIFLDIDRQSQIRLWKLFKAASEQITGTNLLITENVEAEVSRLRNQSTLITPFMMTPDIIRSVTKIDGTVILDKNGICYAIGAILDGNASVNGNRARGGRYNSAVMYYESSNHPCAIFIISQDGDVDFVPSLTHHK